MIRLTIAELILNVHVVVFGPCRIVSNDMRVFAKNRMRINLIQRCTPAQIPSNYSFETFKLNKLELQNLTINRMITN